MYYKVVKNGYILAIGKGNGGEDITESEYNDIMTVIQNHPQETEMTGYKLKDDLIWESYEKEPQPDPSDEELDDTEAIEILLGGAS